jgi:hypothetical protein
MGIEFKGLSRNGRRAVKAIRSVAEQGFVGDVNVQLTKIGLGKIKIPEAVKLDLLATAYEKKAAIDDKKIRADNSHFVPVLEIEAIRDKAVIEDLRRRILNLEQDLTGKA